MIGKPFQTTRRKPLAMYLAVAGFVLNLVAMPFHVVLEDHCRVVDGLEAGIQAADRSVRICHHDCLDAPDPLDSRLAARRGHSDGMDTASAMGDREPAGERHPHCPLPLEAHLARMKGDPARVPSMSGGISFATVAIAPADTIPPSIIRRDLARRSYDPRPPRQLSRVPNGSRAPPVV